MIEEATVDCYNESEQITGWFTMIEDNLAVPFETMVLGVGQCHPRRQPPVTVERIALNRSEQIVAVCRRGREQQSLPILDLPLPTPPPGGAEWIEAYRQAERAAREKARREREAAIARAQHLDALAGRDPAIWKQVEGLIASKQPTRYDQAVMLLVDLRDLAARKGGAGFQQRVEELRAARMRKPTLIDRLQKAGL